MSDDKPNDHAEPTPASAGSLRRCGICGGTVTLEVLRTSDPRGFVRCGECKGTGGVQT